MFRLFMLLLTLALFVGCHSSPIRKTSRTVIRRNGAAVSWSRGAKLRRDRELEIRGNGNTIHIEDGAIAGDLKVRGNGNRVIGSGSQHVTVHGDLIIRGNGNSIKGLRVLGEVKVRGNSTHFDDLRGHAPPAPGSHSRRAARRSRR